MAIPIRHTTIGSIIQIWMLKKNKNNSLMLWTVFTGCHLRNWNFQKFACLKNSVKFDFLAKKKNV